MSTPQTPNTIRDSVQAFYANRARNADPCCGSGGCGDSLYPAEAIADLPQDISSFSLGCGDPITLSSLQPGETVVDLGSGGGLDCFLAARRVGGHGRVIGVDMTPEMLAKARANASRLNVTNVEFREGFIEQLPVADGEADVVISNCVINLSPDKRQVFRELYRALKPGGRVAVSDVVTTGALPEVVRASMEAWGACLAGALDVEEYKRGLEAAGFVDVNIKPAAPVGLGLSALPIHAPFSALITARRP